MNGFPVVIRMTPEQVAELVESEEGAYADDTEAGRPLEAHPHTVAQRFRWRLEIRNDAEAQEMYFAVCSGTFQRSHFGAACSIADALRAVVRERNPAMVQTWPAPYDRGEK